MEPPASRTVEEELRAELEGLKSKTAKWKAVVKAQLEEAAAKNEKLRTDLAAANKRADAGATDVRLELTAEFKERTHSKDEEISRLQDELRTMRANLHAAETQHRAVLAKAAADANEQMASANAAAEATLASRIEHAASLHAAELEKEKRKHDSTRGELRVLSAKCDDLTSQVTTLKKELTAVRETHSFGDAEMAAAEKKKDERHAAEIIALEHRIADRESQIKSLQSKLSTDAAKHEQGLLGLVEKKEAQFRAEIARRDEQLHVANTLLSQAREEAAAAFFRLHKLESESSATVDAAQRRVATVTAELAGKMAAVAQLQMDLKAQMSVNAKLSAQLADAEAESASREAAFAELFDRDFNKDGILRLEQDLHAAQKDLEVARGRIIELEQSSIEHNAAATTASKQQEEAAAALDAKMKIISAREDHLKELEKRIHDNQLKLAQHAQQLQLDQQRAESGKRRDAAAAGSGDEGAILKYDSLVSNWRANRLLIETQGSMILQRYRRFLPFVLIASLLVSLFWFSGSAPTSTYGNHVVEQADSLVSLRRQYDATMRSLVNCEAACPAFAKNGAPATKLVESAKPTVPVTVGN